MGDEAARWMQVDISPGGTKASGLSVRLVTVAYALLSDVPQATWLVVNPASGFAALVHVGLVEGLVMVVRILLVPSANAAGPSKGSSVSENEQAELLDGGPVNPTTWRLSLLLKLKTPVAWPVNEIFTDPTAVP